MQEATVAGPLVAYAAAGPLLDPLRLVAGSSGRAAWGWAHHLGLGAPVVRRHPPFCAAVDLVAGAVLLLVPWAA